MSLNNNHLTITDLQKQVMIGTILGDASLTKVIPNYTNSKLAFSHCRKQVEYGIYKFHILRDIMSSWTDQSGTTNYGPFDRRVFTGKQCKIMSNFRNIFYPNGIKILNIPYLWDNFTEISLAFLFMDDGCRSGKTVNFSLYSFDLSELEDFVYMMKKRFDLEFTIKKDKTLYLRQKSFEHFVELIRDYLHPCMYYKINASCLKTPLNGEVPNLDNTVLKLPVMEENA